MDEFGRCFYTPKTPKARLYLTSSTHICSLLYYLPAYIDKTLVIRCRRKPLNDSMRGASDSGALPPSHMSRWINRLWFITSTWKYTRRALIEARWIALSSCVACLNAEEACLVICNTVLSTLRGFTHVDVAAIVRP